MMAYAAVLLHVGLQFFVLGSHTPLDLQPCIAQKREIELGESYIGNPF